MPNEAKRDPREAVLRAIGRCRLTEHRYMVRMGSSRAKTHPSALDADRQEAYRTLGRMWREMFALLEDKRRAD